MTNLIGMSLVILNSTIVTNYTTNQVGVSCKEAGCTNQIDVQQLEEITPKKLCALHKMWYNAVSTDPCECILATYRTNIVKGCCYWHFKDKVVATVKIKTLTIGTKDAPLFLIFNQTPMEQGYDGTIYHDGTYIKIIRENN